MQKNNDLIIDNDARYFKAVETLDHIYYVDYDSEDAVIMTDKVGNLVSSNYFACNALFEDILADKIIWASKIMQYNISELRKQN